MTTSCDYKTLRIHGLFLLAAIMVFRSALPAAAEDARPNVPAELVVTDKVLRPAEKVPPLGANDWGGCGAVQWAANNFVHNSGNEPVYWRICTASRNAAPTGLRSTAPAPPGGTFGTAAS